MSIVKILPRRTVIIEGIEQTISDESFIYLEKYVKAPGETLEEAIERVYIEYHEGDAVDKPKQSQRKKPNPNTLDNFIER